MNKTQPGIITFTDKHQVQQTAETNSLVSFFNEMRVTRGTDLRNKLSNIFVNGSMKRSLFFMDFRIKEWTGRGVPASYMPVYGIKGGSPGLTRQTNYAEILLCKEEELAGTGFNEIIFGSDYLTGEETVELPENELLDALSREGSAPGCTISKRSRENICRIVEKIWEVQENNPVTRLVIRMEHAEDNSLDLIRQIYLLIPQKLRCQLGFETNIASADLEQVQTYGGIPLYIFTADISEKFDPESYGFPVAFLDLTKLDNYTYNEERLELIRKLASQMNEQRLFDLDYSEKKYMEQQNSSASSFRYFENIVKNMFSGALFWWMRDTVESVEELEKIYSDQSELMNVPAYRKQALTSYYLGIYPQSDLAKQTVEVICNEKYPNRARLLSFLAEELLHRKEIDAVDAMRVSLNRQNQQTLAKQKAEFGAERKKLELELEERQLREKELSGNLAKAVEEKRILEKEIDSLKGEMSNDTIKAKLNKKCNILEDRLRAFQKVKIILGTVAGICAAAAVVMCVLFIGRGRNISELQKSNSELKHQNETIQKSEQELSKDNDDLKKQIEDLTDQLNKVDETESLPENVNTGGENQEETGAQPDTNIENTAEESVTAAQDESPLPAFDNVQQEDTVYAEKPSVESNLQHSD